MTNWCVVILAAFVYLAFYGSGEFNCSSVVFAVCGCLVNDGISRCHQSHTIIKDSIFSRAAYHNDPQSNNSFICVDKRMPAICQ